jgi:hypothetical protein
MDPIMGTIHNKNKPSEIAGYSNGIRILGTVLPGMELDKAKSKNLTITSNLEVLHPVCACK